MRKLSVKGRIKKLEQLQKRIILKINPKCVLCKKDAQVVDHLFSRTHKALFFYRDNLNALCNGCHFQKTYNQMSAAADLFFKTRERLGEDWNTMLDLLKKPLAHFYKEWYLDEIEQKLTKEAKKLGVK